MECSPMARLLFVGMWNFADDAGRMTYSPKTLKAQVYPSDDVSVAEIERLIVELSANDLILIYSAEGKEFISITGWHHQKIDKPKPSKLPGPFDDGSATRSRAVATDLSRSEGIVSDRNSDAGASGAEAPPADDPRTRLFREGLPKLAALTGKGPDSCRSFVGKCLKEVGDDAIEVLAAIEDAERNKVANPSGWIAARLKSRGSNAHGTSQVRPNSLIATIDRELASLEAEESADLALPKGPLLRLSSGPIR
jgi:hypothetical protein